MPRSSARTASSAVDNGLLVVCLLASIITLFLPGEARDRAAGALRRTVVSPLAELQRRAELTRAAYTSYDERATARNAEARAAQDAESLRTENAQLRRMLGLGARLQWGFVNAEAIANELPGELVRKQVVLTFMLTAGGRAGVTTFTPVVTPAGLVGMVQQVDPAMSIAITYSHPDFRVSAMTPDQSAFGIVQPHLGSGAERGLLEMRGVPFRTPLAPGQQVVSSGLGATYPRGVPVGTVLREIPTPEKWARTYLLQPAVSLSDVGPVMLLVRRRADAGVDSVWTSVRAADSASRAVATAGDSVARAAALREAQARRAALDSALTDSLRRDSAAAGLLPAGVPVAPVPGAAGAVAPSAPPEPGSPTQPAPAAPAGPPAPAPAPVTPRPTPPPGAGSAGAARPDSARPRPRPRVDTAAPRPAVPTARPTVPAPAETGR